LVKAIERLSAFKNKGRNIAKSRFGSASHAPRLSARNDSVMEHNEFNAKENRYEKVCFSTTDHRCCHIRSNASTAEAEV
jgi:hypothetical protein